MGRLNEIIEGLDAKEMETKKKLILKSHIQTGEDKGYIFMIFRGLVHIAMEMGLFTANPTIVITNMENLFHVGPFVGDTTYKVINLSGYRPINGRA